MSRSWRSGSFRIPARNHDRPQHGCHVIRGAERDRPWAVAAFGGWRAFDPASSIVLDVTERPTPPLHTSGAGLAFPRSRDFDICDRRAGEIGLKALSRRNGSGPRQRVPFYYSAKFA